MAVMSTTSATHASSSLLPTAVLFLDMDGVMMRDRSTDPLATLIQQKVNELFIKKEGLNSGFTELEWRVAAGHYLDKEAVARLDRLNEKVSKVARFVIVISSAWREDGTLEEIKNQMFAMWSFSKLIIDKTSDEEYLIRRRGEEVPKSMEKYGFDLNRRGRQIDFWLRENIERLNIKSFAIWDDVDEEMSERYPENFVEIPKIVRDEDVDRTYNILTDFTFFPEKFPDEAMVEERRQKKAAERKEACIIQ